MIEIIKDRNTLENIRDEWNELAKAFGSPLLEYEWFSSCADAFAKENDLRVIVVRSDSKITAIAPFVLSRTGCSEFLEIAGSSILGEPGGILFKNNDSLRMVLKEILTLRLPFYLHKIEYPIPIEKFMPSGFQKRGILITKKTSDSAYIPVDTTWDEFLKLLSSRRRYDLKRARRRAEEFGKLSYKISCPSITELDIDMEMAFKIEASGWKGRKGSALLNNRKLNTFFKKYSYLVSQSKILRLCFLFIDDTPVAMLFGVEFGGRFWVLKMGYDEKYSICSPGILLVHETIRYAFANGLKSYEFLGSDEKWLHMWTKDNFRHYISIGYYPFNYLGLRRLSSDLLGFAINKFN